jgi:hypothetical protein
MKKIYFFIALALTYHVHAQYTPVKDLNYSIDNGEVTITGPKNDTYGYDDYITDLNVPPMIDGYPVTKIGNSAFYYHYLDTVVLPASVTHLEAGAFGDCGLISIEIPGVTHIGDGALAGNGIASITLPNSLESLGLRALYNCAFTSITLPASLTSIDESVFAYCNSLTSISVAPENPNFVSLNGVLFNKEVTELIAYPIGNPATTYTIPNSVENIAVEAFAGGNLTSITLSDSLTSIGSSAFAGGNLTSITFPASLTFIDDHAFNYCFDLTSVTFLGNAPTPSDFLFNNATKPTVYIYEGATGFGDTFAGRPVVVLAIPPLPIDSITVENGNLIIKPTNGTEGIIVEQNSDLIDGTWTTITPTIVDGCIQLPASGTADYYRLSN